MKPPHVHVRVDFSERCSVGPGKIGPLEAVARTGSLSAAARSLGVSYRRAWLLLHSLNNSFAEPAVELSVGGKDGGGTRLTQFGKKLIVAYRNFEAGVDTISAQAFSGFKPARQATDATVTLRHPGQRALLPSHPASKGRNRR
jgi:molybdate transport system regulatory protein